MGVDCRDAQFDKYKEYSQVQINWSLPMAMGRIQRLLPRTREFSPKKLGENGRAASEGVAAQTVESLTFFLVAT
jgi:hypothetical protein